MKNILLVFAHPDDESFTSAGTVVKMVKAGWQIHLICATKGDAGMRGPHEETADVGTLREKELDESSKIVGISSITHLGYRDGKMSDINPGELEDILYKKLLELHPDIVITFEPNGISNHPDHMKICLSTTFAFQKYAHVVLSAEPPGNRDPKRRLLHQKKPLATTIVLPKLYYACMPAGIVKFLIEKKVLPKESFGKPFRGVEDKTVTTVIDISKFATKKIQALKAHVTQTSDVERFLSMKNHPLLSQEYFVLRMEGEKEVFMGNNDRVANRL